MVTFLNTIVMFLIKNIIAHCTWEMVKHLSEEIKIKKNIIYIVLNLIYNNFKQLYNKNVNKCNNVKCSWYKNITIGVIDYFMFFGLISMFILDNSQKCFFSMWYLNSLQTTVCYVLLNRDKLKSCPEQVFFAYAMAAVLSLFSVTLSCNTFKLKFTLIGRQSCCLVMHGSAIILSSYHLLGT